MPLLNVRFLPYLFGIILSFSFAEVGVNFPDTFYLLLCLLFYTYFFLFKSNFDTSYSSPERIYILLVLSFLVVSTFWFFYYISQGSLSRFAYPFITVTFNLLGPYILAKYSFKSKFSNKFFYLVTAFIFGVAVWQYFAVNFFYGVEYLYFNERLKSSLFQGQARIPAIFVSANNFGVFLISFLCMLLCFARFSLKTVLTVGFVFIFLYLSFVRKIYLLTVLLLVLFVLLNFRFRFSSFLKKLIFWSLLILPFSFVTIITDGKYEDGVLSSQTMGSRFYQWDYFIDRFSGGGLVSYFFGDYTLQSSFESLGYFILFIDNNFIMSLTFGGLVFALLQVILIFSFVSFFNSKYSVSRSWAIFGILNVFAICWVGLFSNLIDNHEVSVILYSAVWTSLFKIKELQYGKESNY